MSKTLLQGLESVSDVTVCVKKKNQNNVANKRNPVLYEQGQTALGTQMAHKLKRTHEDVNKNREE